jgi:hypothetical protein
MSTRRQSGQVLLAILLLAVLVTSVVLGYARHAIISAENSQDIVACQQAESAADSGLAWARQTLLANDLHTARLALGSGAVVAVNVADAGSGLKTLTIQGSVDGQQQSLVGSVETYAALGGSLPQLTASGRAAVAGAPSITSVMGTQTLHDTTINGVLFLRNGANVTLQDCIVAGTIVSQPALAAGAWAPADATSLTLSGSVVIESDPSLSGVSIIAPDCTVTGNGTEAVQVSGVVVCKSLALTGWGAISGQVATTVAPALASGIDLPGSGREQRPWPASLDTGAEGIVRVSFPRPTVTAGQLLAIRNFAFPSRRVRGGAGP